MFDAHFELHKRMDACVQNIGEQIAGLKSVLQDYHALRKKGPTGNEAVEAMEETLFPPLRDAWVEASFYLEHGYFKPNGKHTG